MFVREIHFFALKIWFDSKIVLSLRSHFKTAQLWKSTF